MLVTEDILDTLKGLFDMWYCLILGLSLTDWSWLLDIICSVALACEPGGDPAPTVDLYLLCLSVCPSVRLSVCPSVRRASPEDAPRQQMAHASQQNARVSFIKLL